MKDQTQYMLLSADGLVVGSIWAHSVKKQSDIPGDKSVWFCDANGDYVASGWCGYKLRSELTGKPVDRQKASTDTAVDEQHKKESR